jgi:excisionase family DNA binding protein
LTPQIIKRDHSVDPQTIGAAAPASDYLPLKQLATYTGLSVRTLRVHLVHRTQPLPYYKIGGKILVRRADFDAWAAQFRVSPPTGIADLVNDVVRGLV